MTMPLSYYFYRYSDDDDNNDDDNADDSDDSPPVAPPLIKAKCSLDFRTQIMVELIFNSIMFEDQMAALNLGEQWKKHSFTNVYLQLNKRPQ